LIMLASLSGCGKEAPTQTQVPVTAAENTQESASPGAVLPFPEPQSASVAGKTLKDSKHQWRKAENHLPATQLRKLFGSEVSGVWWSPFSRRAGS